MRLTFTGKHTNKLHDELIAGGIAAEAIVVSSTETNTYIDFTDETLETTINAIAEAHDPTPPVAPKSEIELLQEQVAALQAQLDLLTQS